MILILPILESHFLVCFESSVWLRREGREREWGPEWGWGGGAERSWESGEL